MIQEDYVSLETARLLKDKEFEGQCSVQQICTETCHNEDSEWTTESEVTVNIPTLQMAMKWLREVHHLFIGCEPRLSFTDFYWITANIYRVRKKSSLYHMDDVDDYHCVACCDSHSYEGACETAIKYCLENLI